jgi:hypothetical protein
VMKKALTMRVAWRMVIDSNGGAKFVRCLRSVR